MQTNLNVYYVCPTSPQFAVGLLYAVAWVFSMGRVQEPTPWERIAIVNVVSVFASEWVEERMLIYIIRIPLRQYIRGKAQTLYVSHLFVSHVS